LSQADALFLYCDPVCVHGIEIAGGIEFLMTGLTEILVLTVTNQVTP